MSIFQQLHEVVPGTARKPGRKNSVLQGILKHYFLFKNILKYFLFQALTHKNIKLIFLKTINIFKKYLEIKIERAP